MVFFFLFRSILVISSIGIEQSYLVKYPTPNSYVRQGILISNKFLVNKPKYFLLDESIFILVMTILMLLTILMLITISIVRGIDIIANILINISY